LKSHPAGELMHPARRPARIATLCLDSIEKIVTRPTPLFRPGGWPLRAPRAALERSKPGHPRE